MFGRLIAAGAVVTMALSPVVAAAQDAAETAEVSDTAAAATDTRTFMPINYNAAEDRENILVLDLSNGKRVQIRLMPSWAPNHVERIKTLTREGFYNGIVFHRVIEGFMAQTGDPTGTGRGSSTLADLKEEFNPMPHLRGTLAMARGANSVDSANSQFFIVFYPRFSLDKQYTNFGRVISGMDAVDAISRGEPPADPTRIIQASIGADNLPVPAVAPPAAEPEITADMLNAPIS